MATYTNRSFSGSWGGYENATPVVTFSFTGYRNTGGNFGCRDGRVGTATYTGTKTYGELGADGTHAKCCIMAKFSGTQWTLSPMGFGWNSLNLESDVTVNTLTGAFNRDIRFITREDTNAPQDTFRYLNDEYVVLNFAGEETGTQTFSASVSANCPIIKVEGAQNLVTLKDGTKTPLKSSTLLSNIALDSFLAPKRGELQSNRFYIYTTCESYNVTGSGAKSDSVNMSAGASWQEENIFSYPSPYLVKSKYNSLPCLKLYLTPKVPGQKDTDTQMSNGVIDYGVPTPLGETYDIEANIYNEVETDPDNAYIKKLGFFYIDGTQKLNNGGAVTMFQTTFLDTNIPIFENEEDGFNWAYTNATEGKGASDKLLGNAINRGDLGDEYNPIGDPVNDMDINAGYTQQAMSTQYALDKAALTELSNNLFNTDPTISGAIQEGLKLYGANPVNCVIDLQYYPFNITDYVQNSAETYIYFGSYKMDFTIGFSKLYNTKCVIDCGVVIFPEQSNSYLDYEPYTELYLYLPYIGTHKVDIATYLNKVINLKYIVDIQTGACVAVVFANGIIIDDFSGEMGAKQHISSIDYASYSQKRFNDFKRTVNPMIDMIGAMSNANPFDAVNATEKFFSGLHDLKQGQNAQHIAVRGASTPTTSFAMPQYAYFYTVQKVMSFPENERAMVGYPSNTGGKVASFSGYLQCEKVSLKTTATEREKQKMISMMLNGFYI